jgi:hypothetical protein
MTGRRNGADGRVHGCGVESTHIRDEGAEDVILNEME